MESISAQITPLDIWVLAGYMVWVLGIAFYYSRYSLQGMTHFFLGGRKIPGWANGISYAATSMNADVPAAYCGMMAMTGIYLSWFYFTRFGLALMIGGILFAVFWRRLAFFTAPEFYTLRFGPGIGSVIRTWIAIRSAFIAMVAWTGAGLLGIHKITGEVLGWELSTTLMVTVPLVWIYVYFSGLKGVIFTDIFQAGIMILANVVLLVTVIRHFGGPVAWGNALVASFGKEVLAPFPPSGDERLGLVALAAWLIGSSLGYGGDTSPMSGAVEGQRLLSCKNSREAVNMYFTTALALFLLLLILTMPTLGGILLWPDMRNSQEEAELIYGRLLAHFLEPGFLGLALAGLSASVMSTVSSNLNFGGQVIANDVYKHLLAPEADQKKLLQVGRITMVVILAMAVLVAWVSHTLIGIAVFMLGLSSAELLANWAQWWWWRFNRYGRLTATLGGPLLFLLAQVFWEGALPGASAFRLGYLSTLTGMGLTTLAWVTVTLLTPPDEMERLGAFYLKARPLGWWKPVREYLRQPNPHPRPLIGRGLALSVWAWVILICLFVGLSGLMVGKYFPGGLGVSLAAGMSYPFWRTVKKFLNHLENG